MSIKVNLDQISNLFLKMIIELKKRGISDVDLNYDYYWRIDPQESFSLSEKHDESIGSLVEDWEHIEKNIINEIDGDDYYLTYLDVEKMSILLLAISNEIYTKDL